MGACFYLIGSKNFNSGLNGAYKAVRRASTSFSIAAKLASISEALVESLSSLKRKRCETFQKGKKHLCK